MVSSNTSSHGIKAVVFDVDGTLLDTLELIRFGYAKTLRDYGFEKEAEDISMHFFSTPLRENYRSIAGESAEEAYLDELVAYHDKVQGDNLHLVTPYEGMEMLLNQLKTEGVKVGVFTSGGIPHIERNFGHLGIDVHERFDALVAADDELPHKPAPDGLLLCIERLGVKPSEAVLVGDHPADMGAGKAARVRATIGVLHGLGLRDELEAAGADYLVPSLIELPALLEVIEED